MFTKYAFVVLGFVIVFSSCGRKERDKEFVVKMLGEELENSYKHISKSTDKIYLMLEQKLYDPNTIERTAVWIPYAKNVQEQFNIIYKNINSLERSKKNDLYYLVKKITEAKKKLLEIAPEISKGFSKNIDDLDKPLDSLVALKKETSLEGIPKLYQLTLLKKIKCNSKILENSIISFCLNESNHIYLTLDSEFPCLHIGQNYGHLKNGETLRIQAAIVTASQKINERININGETVANSYGVGVYDIKVKGDTGVHKIPVEITFFDENGKSQTSKKYVEYTIDP